MEPIPSDAPDVPGPENRRGSRIPNAALGVGLGIVVLLMFSFAYANVPLFKLFCARFGIGGSGKAAFQSVYGEGPALSSSTGPIQSRDIQVKFMGVSATGLPVRFGPSVPLVHVIPGRPVHLDYTFTNMSDDSVFFRAVHSIAPIEAAREFQLIQCFCFEDQALGPRETRVLPVYFALSPRTPGNVHEVQLNYTLFPRDENDKSAPLTGKRSL
ncbi:MAG TPA: cytochrome c oxidase assembly protein [Candidatus Binatia bacterium]|nr:cytochrome c oxidase assembly protein [Candidatus Binatia bacterium]